MTLFDGNPAPCPDFLPMSAAEAHTLGWENVDFVLITGDAYVDHPSFGAAIIGKTLVSAGFSVGIVAQPNWKEKEDFSTFGEPRLGFLITSGNVDSMVNHYTAAKKRRNNDYYSPANKAGLRPDRAAIVYSRRVREIFGKKIPIVLGGLEAGLRRLAHYDYWSDSVRRSIIIDSQATCVVYGAGELQILEIARQLRGDALDLAKVDGVVYKSKTADGRVVLPSFGDVSADKAAYAASVKVQFENAGYLSSKPLAEPYDDCFVVQNAPVRPLTTAEMDAVYSQNFARAPHPSYKVDVPSIAEVKFSITSSRGCFGGCSFCALSFQQGRAVSARSRESIVAEAKLLTQMPDFKGYIHDVGGPTANFRRPSCEKQRTSGVCPSKRCLFPKPCGKLIVDHKEYISILRELRSLPNVKKVFIRSGIRYDYLMYDKSDEFFRELCEHHVSGQLKVAPEHVSDAVLRQMGKPSRRLYDKFVERYKNVNTQLNKNQFLVPYLMSGHPGSTLKEAVELAEYLRDNKIAPEQVQDFYPTPGTLSTCAFHTGVDPLTGEKVFCAKTPHEKALQRALIQYRLPQNYELVREALILAGRTDLIGFDKRCLIRPKHGEKPLVKPTPTVKKKKKTIRHVHKRKR